MMWNQHGGLRGNNERAGELAKRALRKGRIEMEVSISEAAGEECRLGENQANVAREVRQRGQREAASGSPGQVREQETGSGDDELKAGPLYTEESLKLAGSIRQDCVGGVRKRRRSLDQVLLSCRAGMNVSIIEHLNEPLHWL